MTSEDDFQRALDANPDDWQTRLVFADWLEDRGDPRAEGYRALGSGRHRTDLTRSGGVASKFHWWDCDYTDRVYANHPTIFKPVSLVHDWYALLKGGKADEDRKRDYPSRRKAEDAAALAFAKLSAERRSELLAVSLPEPPPPTNTGRRKR